MKTLFTTFFLLALSIYASAQRKISCGYLEIKKAEYDTCRKTAYLTANTKIKKQAGKLIVPVTGKTPKIFNDDSTEENYHEYTYLGDIKGTVLTLLKRTDYNGEEFYLVNRSTGAIDTLIGEPVFAWNMRDFACINNPGTDEKQIVQICELKNGSASTRGFLHCKTNSFLKHIACVNRNFIMAEDNKGKYWRLNFKNGDK